MLLNVHQTLKTLWALLSILNICTRTKQNYTTNCSQKYEARLNACTALQHTALYDQHWNHQSKLLLVVVNMDASLSVSLSLSGSQLQDVCSEAWLGACGEGWNPTWCFNWHWDCGIVLFLSQVQSRVIKSGFTGSTKSLKEFHKLPKMRSPNMAL